MIDFDDDYALFDGFSRAKLVDIIRGYRMDCEKAEAALDETRSDLQDAQRRIKELEASVRRFSTQYLSWKNAGIRHRDDLTKAKARITELENENRFLHERLIQMRHHKPFRADPKGFDNMHI